MAVVREGMADVAQLAGRLALAAQTCIGSVLDSWMSFLRVWPLKLAAPVLSAPSSPSPPLRTKLRWSLALVLWADNRPER